ncbi:Cof-type HAD-IIB family hydrolase [Bacillota bacterium LX-D]|nr:Cof-type HAD-IIB family hydrolase [Bacillota bacterium LX-D]
MSTFKLVAIDLDGTLLNNDLQISPRTQEVIAKVREQGTEVTLCTGRMYASALPYAEQLQLQVPLVTYGGAFVKSPQNGELIYNRNLPVEFARKAFVMAKEYGYHVNVYYQDSLYVEKLNDKGRAYAQRVRVPIHVAEDMLQFLQKDPIKMVVIAEPAELNALQQEFIKKWGEKVFTTKSDPTFLELLHPQATKGKGLEALANYLGCGQNEMIGIGDSHNDLEMFNYVGCAVVMGNAEEEIKRKADYITCQNDDDGVAEALEKLILDC